MSDVPTCQECGACCFSQLEQYVRVSGVDYDRLGPRSETLVSFDGHRAHLRMVAGHCLALQVDPGSGLFSCDAYERRPQTCRELERGSAECRAERDAKADRSRRALRHHRGGD